MVDFKRIHAVKAAAEDRLLALPGVHAVGVGAKVVGGERTTEPSIMVFLVDKKQVSQLRPEEIVPAEIDGVKTDVVEMPIPASSWRMMSRTRTSWTTRSARPSPPKIMTPTAYHVTRTAPVFAKYAEAA